MVQSVPALLVLAQMLFESDLSRGVGGKSDRVCMFSYTETKCAFGD